MRLTALATTALRGTIAGAMATLAMSAVMLVAGRLGLLPEQPPRTIVRRILRRPPLVDSDGIDALASAAHLAFGAGTGSLFALATRPLPIRGAMAPFAGVVFALGLWVGSYAGWVPAMGLLPPPDRDRPGRQAAMIGAHVAFGAALGTLVAVLRRDAGSDTQAQRPSSAPSR